ISCGRPPRIKMRGGGQLLKELLLLGRQPGRYDYLQPHVLVAAAAPPFVQPLAPQPQAPAALGARRYRHFYRACQRGNANLGSQSRFPRCDRQVGLHVVLTYDGENWVWLQSNVQKEVARRTATCSRLALACKPDHRSIADSCWNSHFESP